MFQLRTFFHLSISHGLAATNKNQHISSMTEVLAIVPARGGSRGLHGKNLLPLAGHPLIAYSIVTGLQAKLVNRVICSTDSEEIATAAREYGAEVPFMRPSELAQGDSPDIVFSTMLSQNLRRQAIVQTSLFNCVRPILFDEIASSTKASS
jgi:CMP-N-acetylneuraminic acid synthetase